MADVSVTIAIPVRNAGRGFEKTLAAAAAQEVDRDLELLVADSGSTDGSAELARAYGATVFPVARFSHGGTRNELMERARGEHVAFLTQDAVPAGPDWLAALLDGFSLAGDVGLVCGPYEPRPDAPLPVARELRDWFGSLSADGEPRLYRDREARGPSPATFFTDANGCVAREAWLEVPFRTVPYAEDQLLASDMLRAGYAKVFAPAAVVVHSHAYAPVAQFRRSFDEWRGLREIHGWVEPLEPARVLAQVRADAREIRAARLPARDAVRALAGSLRHWTVRAVGAAAGSRADHFPAWLRCRLSLEGRGTFEPVEPRPSVRR